MFPLSIGLYVKLGAIALALLFSAYLGYSFEHSRFMAFKQEIETTSRLQEEKVKSIRSQQELVTKGIENEYEAKIVALRNYYKSTSVWNNGGSQMSGLSTTPSVTDVIASYNQLTERCAETTQQLISLQEWLNQQIGIK
jgi:predicted solute-binding protein